MSEHDIVDDDWFQREVGSVGEVLAARTGGVSVAAARRAARTRRQLLVLGLALVAVLTFGAVAGAFGGGGTAATLQERPVASPRALAAAERAKGSGMLSDERLLAGLAKVAAARAKDRAAAVADPAEAPVTPAVAADTAKPLPEVTAPKTAPIRRRATTATKAAKAPKAPRAAAKPARKPAAKPAPKPAVATKPAVAEAPKPAALPAGASEADKLTRYIADGKAAKKARRWRDAVSAYGKALAIDANNLSALVGRGQASYELKRNADAKRDLKAALAIRSTQATALRLLGSIAQNAGDTAAARGYYERYLKRYPSGKVSAEIRAILDHL